MSDRRTPAAPQSSATLVGMGAVEDRPIPREEAATPPHGTDADALRAADVSLILGEIRNLEEHQNAARRRVEEQQDATIDDVRELARSVRELLAATKAMDEALFGLLGLPGEVAKLSGRVGDLVGAVRSLDTRIGRPPSAEDFARASHADATPDELARLEEDARLGTGMWRFVMDLHLRSSRAAARAAGLSGSGGAVVGAVVVELVRLIAGG